VTVIYRQYFSLTIISHEVATTVKNSTSSGCA